MGKQPDEPRPYELEGAKPDILSADNGQVYMRHLAFDPESLEEQEPERHLFSPAGFLDDTWWHRTYWIYGTHFYAGYIGWFFSGHEAPGGRIMARDDSTIYGYSYRPEYYRGRRGRKYHLFAAPIEGQPEQRPYDYDRSRRAYPKAWKVKYDWSTTVPALGRALVLAGDRLFLAGPPDNALESLPAWKGEQGSKLVAVSASDGEKLRTYEHQWVPVFDGMAAAGGRLYVSTTDGLVVCMSGESD